MTLAKDTVLENRYRIGHLLGRGGMGAVYRGFDTNLDIPVAIKENSYQTQASIPQFQREARILARLHHPNLPRVIHHFSFEGKQYLVMDFIEGQDLWQMIKGQGQPFEERQALDYIIQVCQAVNYLHNRAQPIIHRDIKPQNIKVTSQGRAVLVDFGIAKVGSVDSRTVLGAQGVTPGFSPPEQYSGLGTDQTSDIYALGATLYATLTGKRPPDSIRLMTGKVNFEPPDAINPKLSRQVSQAITHAMQSQQAHRPPSVASWQQELKGIMDSLPAEVSALPLPSPPSMWLVSSGGQSYQLGPGSVIMGRSKHCDIRINDPQASREHAVLEFDGQVCIIYDKGGTNGTYIETDTGTEDKQVDPDGMPFNLGDRVRIGQTTFTLSTTAPESDSVSVKQADSSPPVDDRVETADEEEAIPASTNQSRTTQSVLIGGAAILVAGGVILLAIIGGIFFYMSNGNDGSALTTSSSSTATIVASAPEITNTPVSAVSVETPEPSPTTHSTPIIASPTVQPPTEEPPIPSPISPVDFRFGYILEREGCLPLTEIVARSLEQEMDLTIELTPFSSVNEMFDAMAEKNVDLTLCFISPLDDWMWKDDEKFGQIKQIGALHWLDEENNKWKLVANLSVKSNLRKENPVLFCSFETLNFSEMDDQLDFSEMNQENAQTWMEQHLTDIENWLNGCL